MTPDEFLHIMTPVFDQVAERALDQELARDLNAAYPSGDDAVRAIEAACHAAIDAGWMCDQGGEGRRFGRVIPADDASRNLSVDVVDLTDIVGPHHVHPTVEVGLTMPVTPGATFDGDGAGWSVNEPGSDHFPMVAGGRALVLYLLPGGEIEFTGKAPD